MGTAHVSPVIRMFVDSHCHLDFPKLVERIPEVLAAMAENRVAHALCVSVSLEGFPQIIKLAEAHGNLFASVGVHPDGQDVAEPTVETLVRFAAHEKVVAIGETGLDYYWHKGNTDWQRERFRIHIRAARQASKPLIVHTREAASDTLAILKEEGASEAGGVMHCFTETWEVAKAALDLGFYISFSGIVTFKNAEKLREVATRVPLDRLLIETDAPYLAPSPHRGKVNEPAYVARVAEAIAKLRGLTVEAVGTATTENFFELFHSARQ